MYSHGDHPDLMMAPDKYDLPNADTIVLYGCNPAWSQHSSMYWLKNAQKAGVKFVFVGPDYNATAAAMDARWIRVRPGTDTAFLLAVAYEMVRLDEERGDIIDWDFVNERTVGFTPETMPADATPTTARRKPRSGRARSAAPRSRTSPGMPRWPARTTPSCSCTATPRPATWVPRTSPRPS